MTDTGNGVFTTPQQELAQAVWDYLPTTQKGKVGTTSTRNEGSKNPLSKLPIVAVSYQDNKVRRGLPIFRHSKGNEYIFSRFINGTIEVYLKTLKLFGYILIGVVLVCRSFSSRNRGVQK